MQERKRLDVTVVYLHQAFISFVVLYKRGFVMFGVVSLTMGNSAFPFGDRLLRNPHLQRRLSLRQPLYPPKLLDPYPKISLTKHFLFLRSCFPALQHTKSPPTTLSFSGEKSKMHNHRLIGKAFQMRLYGQNNKKTSRANACGSNVEYVFLLGSSLFSILCNPYNMVFYVVCEM